MYSPPSFFTLENPIMRGMKIIWRAQVAGKFLLNHPEYTITFDPVVAGVRKHSLSFLRKYPKGRLPSKSLRKTATL